MVPVLFGGFQVKSPIYSASEEIRILIDIIFVEIGVKYIYLIE